MYIFKWVLLSCSVLLIACGQNRKPKEFQSCKSGSLTAPADSFGILVLPEKKWYAINEQGLTELPLHNKGLYTIRRVSKNNQCDGSSKLILAYGENKARLELNFIYNGSLADTDTLSVLGLLNFKDKVMTITEVFPEANKLPINRGQIVIK